MIIVEILFAISFLILSGIAITTDLQSGIILNKSLLPFLGEAAILNLIYYVFFARDIMMDFLVNIILICIIGMLLFYTHSFAGGDCKLGIVLALLYPGRCYLAVSGKIYTLYIAIGLAILYGYIYLFAGSIWKIVTRKRIIEPSYVKNYLLVFLKSFVIVTIYISGISLLTILVESHLGIEIDQWISSVICLVIAWITGKSKWMKTYVLVGTGLVIDIILIAITCVIPISINPLNYVMAIVLLVCQMTISTDLYDEIAIGDLKKGMILSTISSVLMQGSNVRGLPGVSSEDLRNRLTDTEVESIKRWAKSRNVINITVVRKIPFAIFLVLGYVTYFISWSVIK